MAELAVVSVRKAKMQKYLEEENKNAQIVMDLLKDPNEFFFLLLCSSSSPFFQVTPYFVITVIIHGIAPLVNPV